MNVNSSESTISKTSNREIITTSSRYNSQETYSHSTETTIKITPADSYSHSNFEGLTLNSTNSAQSANFFSDQNKSKAPANSSNLPRISPVCNAKIARANFFSNQHQATGSAGGSNPFKTQFKFSSKPAEIEETNSGYRTPINSSKPKQENSEASTSILRYQPPFKSNYNSSSNNSSTHNATLLNRCTQDPQLRMSLDSGSPTSKKLKPGVLYIFNHKYFDSKGTRRDGTDADVENLIKTFRDFNLEINNPYNDLKVCEIKSRMKDIQRRDFTDCSCIVIAILSHGDRNNKISARDEPYGLDEIIVEPVLQIKSLKDRAKIFIIQACKGNFEVHDNYQTDSNAPELPQTICSPKETLKFFSTFEGFVALRHVIYGSVFIQETCDKLAKHGMKDDIESIIKIVIDSVNKSQPRQIASRESTLSKPYIFGDYM